VNITPDVFKKIREVHGMSMSQFGELLNVSKAQVCFIEKGERPLSDRIRQTLIDEFLLTRESITEMLTIHNRYKVR
jgi:transcriptional regulator with XRE-family HTH domain